MFTDSALSSQSDYGYDSNQQGYPPPNQQQQQPFIAPQTDPSFYTSQPTQNAVPTQQAPPQGFNAPNQPGGGICQNKIVKGFAVVLTFIIAPILMGVVGILCPFLLIIGDVQGMTLFAPFLFSVYCFVFGLAIFLIEFKVKFLLKVFLFLASYTCRAFFIMFLGTLSMLCYHPLDKTINWIGYIVGGTIIFLAIIQLMVGCTNKEWRAQQEAKYIVKDDIDTHKLDGPAVQASPTQNTQPNYVDPYAPKQIDQSQSQYGAQAQTYPSLADNNQSRQPESSSFFGSLVMAGLSSQSQSNQNQNQNQGQSQPSFMQNMATSIMANPEARQMAFNVAVDAAQNPAVQEAARQAAKNSASVAYDSLFED